MQSFDDLTQAVDKYMSRTSGLEECCGRCLETKRWSGSVVLMVVDAAFTSIGLNYFTAVAPNVIRFEKELVVTGKVQALNHLAALHLSQVQSIWKNGRSWQMAKEVASYLHRLAVVKDLDDRGALRCWAANSCLDKWKEDPIGKIKGVGIITFQYLRMMGGIDTAMPDKIVRRVVRQILNEANADLPTEKDMELINTIEQMAKLSGYKSTEICWMTWLIQPEGHMIRMDKYQDLLGRI